jgi:hypothetical protein
LKVTLTAKQSLEKIKVMKRSEAGKEDQWVECLLEEGLNKKDKVVEEKKKKW